MLSLALSSRLCLTLSPPHQPVSIFSAAGNMATDYLQLNPSVGIDLSWRKLPCQDHALALSLPFSNEWLMWGNKA